MPTTSPVLRLKEQPDVFVDALVADHRDQLLLCSVYGRDTSVQQLFARLHQGTRQGGIESLTAEDGASPTGPASTTSVAVGDPRRLDKVTGRLPRTGLLGNLVHTWIFDPALREIDHANRCAWIVEPRATARPDRPGALRAQTWALVRELSPVPLLDRWGDIVLDHLQRNGAFIATPHVGALDVLRIQLPEDFPDWVSNRVRLGDLVA